MSITYNWNVKFLKQDDRGYATSLFCELSGTNGEITKIASVVNSFGGNDYKPYSQWTQEEIDSFAESNRIDLEANITEQLNNGV
jgi:hypothetical protein